MSIAGESHGRTRQLREKAQELSKAAERSTDPDERRRLQEKAKRLEEQSRQESRIDDRGMDPR